MHIDRLLPHSSLSSVTLSASSLFVGSPQSTLTVLSPSVCYPGFPSIIYPSSHCAFHRTLHCPLLSFSKSQQLVSCLWHQGPDWAPACSQGGYCLTVWAKSPVSLGRGQAVRDHLTRVVHTCRTQLKDMDWKWEMRIKREREREWVDWKMKVYEAEARLDESVGWQQQ